MQQRIEIVTLTPPETAAVADGTAGPTIRGWAWCAGDVLPAFVARIQLQRLDANEEWFWCAARVFVDASAGVAVGSGAFKCSPTDGAVEIGYGVVVSFAGRGFATQGVSVLLSEAFSRPEVRAVTAETSITNAASQRVLQKNNFARVGSRNDPEDGPLFCWRIERRAGSVPLSQRASIDKIMNGNAGT